MSKFGVMVMGPAGAGKSTFCSSLLTHLNLNRRSSFYVNLDPAAETFDHEPDLDIKELISLNDVMDELELGPNGALIYCFEFLMDNLDFLTSALDALPEEYLIVIDMPGQIELYTHIPILPRLVHFLTRPGSLGIRLCAAYLLEATFVVDRAKFFSGTLSAMSAMLLLEVPHLNILSKMDLIKGQVRRADLARFLAPDVSLADDDPMLAVADDIASAVHTLDPAKPNPANPDPPPKPPLSSVAIHSTTHAGVADEEEEEAVDNSLAAGRPATDGDLVMKGASFRRLNRAVAQLIDSFSMINYLKLDLTDEDSIGAILSHIDDCIQFHEAQEPRDPQDELDEDIDD